VTETHQTSHAHASRRASPSSWITEGSFVRALLRLSLPMMAQALLQDVFSIVDMLFVGRLGPEAVAAVGACGTLMGIFFMLSVGITTGCMALVAQAVGAGNRARRKCCRTGPFHGPPDLDLGRRPGHPSCE